MNVFVVPSAFPNTLSSGSGIFVYQQCMELAKRGCKVTVLDASCVNYKNWTKKFCRSISVNEKDSCTVYAKHVRGLMMSRLPRYTIAASKRIVNQLYQRAVKDFGKPDLLIGHFSFPGGFVAAEIAQREKIPCIVIEHGSIFLEDKVNPYILGQLKRLLGKAESFICVSESLKKKIAKHTGTDKNIQVIPNMIADRFRYFPAPEKKTFAFFSAGNLNRNKRFDLLIDGFYHAFRNDAKVTLTIAGRGEDAAFLQSKIDAYHAGEQIKLIGWIPNEQMLDRYRDCHCFVLLSEKETFGIVYREAMAVGRPVVATRNGGIEEEWSDIQGILISDAGMDPVADALKRMYENYTDYNGREISDRCVSRYSADVVMSRQLELMNLSVQQKEQNT